MSGIAFILTGCDFSAKNLGKVTFLEDANLTGLTISGEDTVNGLTSTYSVGYLPANTSQRGVTWSVVTGGAYATIDTNTGVLTVLSGANASAVTIKATSTIDNTIIATKSITVTYANTVDILTSISINSSDTYNAQSANLGLTYSPNNTSKIGVTWSIIIGNSYATINANTGVLSILPGATSASIRVRAVSNYDPNIYATKDITVTYKEPVFNLTNNVAYVPFSGFDANMTIYAEFDNAIYSGSNNECLITGLKQTIGNSGNGEVDCCVISEENVTGANKNFTLQQNGFGSTGSYACARSYASIGTLYSILLNKSMFLCSYLHINGTSYASGQSLTLSSLSRNVKANSGFLYLNATSKTVRTHNLNEYATNELLTSAVQSGDAIPVASFGIKKLICYKNTSYTTVADILANRANADVDIKFDGAGLPYNAGSSGSLIYSKI